MTTETNTATLAARIKDALNGEYGSVFLLSAPEIDATAGEIDEAGIFSHIEGRDAYLAWVADYKALIKDLEAYMRSLHTQRRTPGVDSQAFAQSALCSSAKDVTALILKRRLGKVWSAAQAKKRLDNAA
jgi:hypothetical protein